VLPVSATSVVLHTGGLRFGTEKAVLERVLGRRPGVLSVSANPASQTTNVTFDPEKTSVADLRRTLNLGIKRLPTDHLRACQGVSHVFAL
jgi:copper chaperone CopZ